MTLQSSGAISLANVQTEFGGSNPIGINEYYAGGAYVQAGGGGTTTFSTSIGSGQKAPLYGSGGGTYPPSGWTGVLNGSVDDASIQLPTLPFIFYINNTGYNSVFIGSNSYLTFGSGFAVYTGLSASYPAIPKLMFGAGDNSYQRISTFVSGTDSVSVRYEGNGATSGSVGSPGIVVELTLYNPSKFGGLNVIEMLVGLHNRTGGVSNISNTSAAYATYTISANTSYVFTGNSTGTSWTISSGSRVNSAVGSGVPASGTISLYDFYGKTGATAISAIITANAVSIDEGSTVTFTINTTNFPSGTLYWTILTSYVNASDFTNFTGDALSGSIIISSSVAYLSRQLLNDSLSEGPESFALQVRTGSTSGPVIGTSPGVTVNDTSITPGGFAGFVNGVFGSSSGSSSSVSSNTFTSNLLTPGSGYSPKTFQVSQYGDTAGGAGPFPSMTLQYYQGGVLNTTWSLSTSAILNYQTFSFTATFGSSSMQFVSNITDSNSYDDQTASQFVADVPPNYTYYFYHSWNLTGGGQYDVDYDD